MKFSFSSQKYTLAKADVLGIFLFDGEASIKESANFLPIALSKEVIALARQSRFTGKEKTICVLHTHRKLPAFLLVFAGLGKKDAPPHILSERIREASALIGNTASAHNAGKIALIVPPELKTRLLGERIGEAIAEGMILGTYEFAKYKKQTEQEKRTRIKEVIILGEDKKLIDGAKRAEIVCDGVTLARDLVNEPAHFMSPSELADTARSIARKFPSKIALTIFSKKELEEKKFGGILAVAQGSSHEPHLIHLIYRPSEKTEGKKLAVVGKGITFDSGGLSIKPAQAMETMKTDMAGAAAVLGLFAILPRLRVTREIHGIIAACENMVSGTSIRPGDVITMYNKTTVEVLNTDAEGRIILGDALAYACEQKADEMVDLATLTGACIAALGDAIAGVIGNDKKLIEKICDAGETSGEKNWPLPLEESYKDAMKSDIADLRNISNLKGGGAIMGAIFLERFVGKTPWAHLDIAGPAWVDKPLNTYIGRGATGFGVRTMIVKIIKSEGI